MWESRKPPSSNEPWPIRSGLFRLKTPASSRLFLQEALPPETPAARGAEALPRCPWPIRSGLFRLKTSAIADLFSLGLRPKPRVLRTAADAAGNF